MFKNHQFHSLGHRRHFRDTILSSCPKVNGNSSLSSPATQPAALAHCCYYHLGLQHCANAHVRIAGQGAALRAQQRPYAILGKINGENAPRLESGLLSGGRLNLEGVLESPPCICSLPMSWMIVRHQRGGVGRASLNISASSDWKK